MLFIDVSSTVIIMGELQEKRAVLAEIFNEYDREGVGELSADKMQLMHGDIRIGGISMPQVEASLKYVCATDTVMLEELYDLLQEMDRRYFLVQNFRWEFSLLDKDKKDVITEEQARWFVEAVHGKFFSKRNWDAFVQNRPMPGTGLSFAEIEVMLCDIPSAYDMHAEEEAERIEREGKYINRNCWNMLLPKKKERLQREKDERRKKDWRIKRKKKKRGGCSYKKKEERLARLKREEEERRIEEENNQDAELQAMEALKHEKEAEEQLKNARDKEEEARLKRKYIESKHKRIRTRLKVAIKARDRFELEYSIEEFKTEKLEDSDMDLAKAQRLLKELSAREGLVRAMSKREIEELENAIATVKKHGMEVTLADELIQANHLLNRLHRLERIKHEILELKQSTVAEIRSYQKPPPVVHTIMTATFLLLGYKEKETKEWKSVQAMVGRTGKESLKRMCLGLNAAAVEVPRAKRVKELLKNFELDEIRDVSAGAATFYVWSTAIIEEVIDRAETPLPSMR
ncbi:hypothetical protein ScPMuIL_005365 [Solemya velum]